MTGSVEERLIEWREGMQPLLLRLAGYDSLDAVEAVVVAGNGTPPGGLLEAAMGYLGEALLDVAGGRWGWDAERDVPIVHPDPALDLPPVDPLAILTEAVRTRTGRELTGTRDALAAAVAAYTEGHQGWTPSREPTPGLTPTAPGAPDPWLVDWLAERAKAFPRWAAVYGGDADWDFSPESLDAFEALVREKISTVEDFALPELRDFVDGAQWYLGEVAVRNRNARWRYVPVRPDSPNPMQRRPNPWIGLPYVEQQMRDGNAAVPYRELRYAVDRAEPGCLRERFADYRT